MPRCFYRHSAFKGDGYQCDGSDQCWITETEQFGNMPNMESYCIFHAPDDGLYDPAGLRDDWKKETRGTTQASTLRRLLEQWNAHNAEEQEPVAFLLPGLRCGHANFRKFTFSGEVIFTDGIFSDGANFHSATFNKLAEFRKATFSGNPCTFESAKFKCHAGFHSATFNDFADFDSVTFSGSAEFRYSTFDNTAHFPSATFGERAIFADVTFSFLAIFNQATFCKEASFTNAKFHSEAGFISSRFEHAPAFGGASLHQNTDFRGADFLDVESRDAPPAYRTLKLAMSAVRSRSEEAMFYALEQDSLRHQSDTSLPIKLFSFFYKLLANYGRSFVRPLGWLLFVSVAFWFGYSEVLPTTDTHNGSGAFRLRFTAEQLVRPFNVWTAQGAHQLENLCSDHIVLLLQIAASLQSILSLTLVALFLLAVRRQFKME